MMVNPPLSVSLSQLVDVIKDKETFPCYRVNTRRSQVGLISSIATTETQILVHEHVHYTSKFKAQNIGLLWCAIPVVKWLSHEFNTLKAPGSIPGRNTFFALISEHFKNTNGWCSVRFDYGFYFILEVFGCEF